MKISRTSDPQTLVIGAGNPLMCDDGTGIVALEQLREQWTCDADIELVDGGTWGMNLLPQIEDCTRLLILDAVNAGRPAGTLIVLERDDVPRFLSHKMSPHQIDLREVLALAEFRGRLPVLAVVIGVQPERIEMGTELSASVARSIDDLVGCAVDRLRLWGHQVTMTGMAATGA